MHKTKKNKTGKAQPVRNRLIAAVHALAREMDMDTNTRRSFQRQVTGKSSCAAMTDFELDSMLKAMRQEQTPAGEVPFRHHQNKPQYRPQADARARKVAAMWHQLSKEGVIANSSPQALNAFVQRQVGIATLNWVKANADYDALIFALHAMARRAGVRLNG